MASGRLFINNGNNKNKKILLRERKRHTARRVASTRYAVPVGGTPTWEDVPPIWEGGTPLPGKGAPSPPPASIFTVFLTLRCKTTCDLQFAKQNWYNKSLSDWNVDIISHPATSDFFSKNNKQLLMQITHDHRNIQLKYGIRSCKLQK